MAHDLVFNNGLIVTPNGIIHGAVAVDGEQIVEIGASGTLGEARKVVDLDGRMLLPGLVDPHVHFGFGDIPGDDTMVEDFRHNSKDCLIGGVTTIVTTTMTGADPLTSLFDRALRCAEGHSFCDYKFTTVVATEEQLADIPAVAARGGVSFKFFAGYMGEQAVNFGMLPEGITPDFFLKACETLAKQGAPVFPSIHAEDPYVRGVVIDRLRKESPRADILTAFAETSPEWAESVQVFTYGLVAQKAGVPLYPVHISAAKTLDTVQYLRSSGVNIVGETLALFLNTTAEEMDRKDMGAKAKIQPPIRHEADRQRLWQGLREGTISVVGTDSLTYSSKYKEGADFWECRVGVNLQVADTLPLMLNEGVNNNNIDIETLARVLSTNAAKRFGMYPKKGAIAVGSDADLVVVNPDKEVTLGVERLRGLSDYSLWEGKRVKGAAEMTFLRGQLVMQDGEIVATGPTGEFVSTSSAA
jgi:dihydropyrimidinase